MSLRRSKIVFALLLPHRGKAEVHFVLAEQTVTAVKVQLVLAFVDDDVVRRRDFLGVGAGGNRGGDREQHQTRQNRRRFAQDPGEHR